MTLASSGLMGIGGSVTNRSINVELRTSPTSTGSLNQTSFRALAGVPSGVIAVSNFYGKQYRIALTYTFGPTTGNVANASLNIASLSGYVSGITDVTIYVTAGYYLYATSTSNAGLTITGGSTGDTVTLVNQGYIMGQGANGGSTNGGGGTGGPALSLGFATTINNTYASAYIGGGGGGGGGGSSGGGGGGAGGGNGGTGGSSGAAGASSPGASGSNSSTGAGGLGYGHGGTAAGGGGSTNPLYGAGSGGGGGGRVFPGVGGADSGYYGGTGGSSNGGGYSGGRSGGGGGGGWGASGGSSGDGGGGGGGGKAVQLNGNSVTWVSGDTTRVWGAVS